MIIVPTVIGAVGPSRKWVEKSQGDRDEKDSDHFCNCFDYRAAIFGQPAPDLNIRYVILDNGDSIKGLPIDSGQILSCVLNHISVQDEK